MGWHGSITQALHGPVLFHDPRRLPELDEGAIAIQAIRIPSVSLPNSLNTAALIEKAVKEFPEVKAVVAKTGRPDLATDPMGVEISDIIVTLEPKSKWVVKDKEKLVDKIRERLEAIPGINFSFTVVLN